MVKIHEATALESNMEGENQEELEQVEETDKPVEKLLESQPAEMFIQKKVPAEYSLSLLPVQMLFRYNYRDEACGVS